MHVRDFDAALRVAGEYQDIFGKDNFFIEIQDHGIEAQRRIMPDLLEIARRLDAPLLATNDATTPGKEEAERSRRAALHPDGRHASTSRTVSSSRARTSTSRRLPRCGACSPKSTIREPATTAS